MHSGFMALRNDCSMSVGMRLKRHDISDALQAGLAENFRDAEHENEILAQGVLLADLRVPVE
jgi:hypothetical protein